MWWHEKLQDYNFKILHVAGKNNTPADALSHPCDDKQEMGEQQLSLLLEGAFLNLTKAGNPNLLETLIAAVQQQYRPWLKARQGCQQWMEDQGQWLDADQKVVIPLD